MPTLADRYAALVAPGAPAACWPWRGATTPTGHGYLYVAGRQVQARRIAYQLAYGRLPPGQRVAACPQLRACCNPAHLALSAATPTRSR